ncbi:MAG: glycosyltransferase family 39 protein [Spirochaeta sp.]|nr:glycosyltransferase family 39 protein [Spirochaeta sp.]
MRNWLILRYPVIPVLLVLAAVSAITLPWYPFVHSDEVWLASLTRTMVEERSLAATEEFFALTPRYPHAIKSLYHLIQMPFLAMDFSHVAARLPSALAGLASVWFLYLVVAALTRRRVVAALIALAFGLDPQHLYISHLARQEALILAIMLAAIAVVTRRAGGARGGRDKSVLVAGTLLGVSIFIHPNAFVTTAAVTPWVVFAISGSGVSSAGRRWRRAPGVMLHFLGPIVVAAGIAVAASFMMDGEFLRHYASFGDAVGVSDNWYRRWFRFRSFFSKLAAQNAGTYYLPPVASRMWYALVLGVGAATTGCIDRRVAHRFTAVWATLASGAGVAVALFIIGKYSPPSAVFFLPTVYLLAGLLAGWSVDQMHHSTPTRPRWKSAQWLPTAFHTGAWRVTAGALLIVTIALPLVDALREVPRWYQPSGAPGRYSAYVARVAEAVTPEESNKPPGNVLANLNAGFAFYGDSLPGDRLRVYRDFGALPRGDDTALQRFLAVENVEYVVLPRDELEIIYRMRPVWNDVYGNPSRFYPQLQEIIAERGTLVARFPAPVYGMRLVRYLDAGGASTHAEPAGGPVVEVYRLDR